jgi:hypothetical protein
MKKTIIFTLIICVLAAFSCKKSESLSEKRAKERAAISKYITDNSLQVTKTLPADTIFDENEYYHSPSGLYLHIINKGEGKKPQTGDKIIYRFYVFNMSGDTICRYMYAVEYVNAASFKFGDTSFSTYGRSSEIETANKGIAESIGYLGTDGAAYTIIPSSISYATAQSGITPYIVEIRHIKIE